MKRAYKSSDFEHSCNKASHSIGLLKLARVPSGNWKNNLYQMKHIFLTYLLLAVLGSFSADAQSKKVKDDIYYTAEDAQKDAEAAEKERQALEEARAKRAAEREAQRSEMGYESGEEEYIDYDDDEYYYANRFNRFNGPYVGASYWAYDPFFWDPWWGGGYYARGWGMGPGWGWGPSWGVGVGFGGPYWSSYWGWNSWYGYPGFYSAWNSPWMYGGYGGYYNGFYDGYYAGAYGGGAMGNVRTVSYGPRSSINRYPGSLRSTTGRTGTGSGMSGGTRGQLRRSSAGELREAPNRNYSRSAAPVSSPSSGIRSAERRGGNTTEQYNSSEPARNNNRYNNGATQSPARSYDNTPNSRSYQAEPAQQAPSRSYQRAEPAQRSQPSYQRSEPSYQRSQPSYNSSPSRSGGSNFGGGGGRMGGGRR